MNYGVKFWDRIAKFYSKRPVADENRYQKKLEATQRYFHKDMKVFEFGCGTGSTAIIHAPFVKSYLATDLSKNMLNIARQKPECKDLTNLRFEQMAIEEYPDDTEQFDAILGLSILHLLNNPNDALKKAHHMLSPGGLLITSTTCIKGSMPLFRWIAPIGGALGLIPRIQFFAHDEVEQRINNAGFRTKFKLPIANNTQACFLISEKLD